MRICHKTHKKIKNILEGKRKGTCLEWTGLGLVLLNTGVGWVVPIPIGWKHRGLRTRSPKRREGDDAPDPRREKNWRACPC